MRDGTVKDILRYDELAILYGNSLCEEYREKYHHKMIRARLRALGRFIIEVKKINPSVKELRHAIHPLCVNDVIKAVHAVGKLNKDSGRYEAPASAGNLSFELMNRVPDALLDEGIMKQDKTTQVETENFAKLLKRKYRRSISRTVAESQLEQKRRKLVVLPSTADVKKLLIWLREQKNLCCSSLEEKGFSVQTWKNLAGYTLSAIQVFNRRRPGEMERLVIKDYKTHKAASEYKDIELLSTLPAQSRSAINEYVRVVIRGKRSRGVAVLLHQEDVRCIDLILKYREEAGVPEFNPYVFGVAGATPYNHLRATDLLRTHSSRCGANNPTALRGTRLRQHVATQAAVQNLSGREVEDLATFLGHQPKIHMEHYRLPTATRDIVQMSQILKKAQGTNILRLCELYPGLTQCCGGGSIISVIFNSGSLLKLL